jgi:hypothetical protein
MPIASDRGNLPEREITNGKQLSNHESIDLAARGEGLSYPPEDRSIAVAIVSKPWHGLDERSVGVGAPFRTLERFDRST